MNPLRWSCSAFTNNETNLHLDYQITQTTDDFGNPAAAFTFTSYPIDLGNSNPMIVTVVRSGYPYHGLSRSCSGCLFEQFTTIAQKPGDYFDDGSYYKVHSTTKARIPRVGPAPPIDDFKSTLSNT